MTKKEKQTECILCGKLRVFSKTWKAKAEGRGSMVTYIKNVCPDVICQKKVDAKFTEIRERREASEEKRRNNLNRRKKVLATPIAV